jgi:hypothetical protein
MINVNRKIVFVKFAELSSKVICKGLQAFKIKLAPDGQYDYKLFLLDSSIRMFFLELNFPNVCIKTIIPPHSCYGVASG